MRQLVPYFVAGAACVAASFFLHTYAVDPADALVPVHGASPAEAPPLRAESDGIRLDFDLLPAGGSAVAWGGEEAIATLSLSDAATGEPLHGARPRAWLSLARPDEETGSCADRVKRFSAGRLSARPDADLNQTFVLAMNSDNTITVIDTHLAFARTKLRSLITLPAPGGDWALHPDRSAIYVSVPAADSVSVIDTRSLLATGSIPVGSRPGRIALAPDGRRLWISNDGAKTVTIVDHAGRAALETLDAGDGPRRFAFGDQGRMAWITSDGSGELHGFDAFTFERKARLEIGAGPLLLAASPQARAVWVGRAEGELIEVDERTNAIRRRIELPAGMSDLRFDPSGRWAFALFPDRGEVAVVDASAGTIRTVLDGLHTPDAISFSSRFAYLRERTRPAQILVDLRALASSDTIPLVEVHLGQASPSAGTWASLASPMAPLSTGDGMIIASPADRTLIYYAEGMMAPMGALQNYGREPRAALLLDRSLFEVQPGLYRTDIRLPAAGRYDLTVFLDQPRHALCLELPIEARPGEEPAGPALQIEPLFDPSLPLEAGREHRLRFRIDGADDLRPEEIVALAFRPPGSWQWRGNATVVEGDSFEIVVHPPQPGRVKILTGIPGRGAPLGTIPPLDLAVTPANSPQAENLR